MRTRTHAALTFGAAFAAIGLLIGLPDSVTSTATVSDSESSTVSDAAAIVAPTRDGVYQPMQEGDTSRSHCVATVDEGLDWYAEGRTATLPWDETSIMYAACDVLGHASEAYIWPDGSWRVTATVEHDGPEGVVAPGVYWRGCFSVGTCMG